MIEVLPAIDIRGGRCVRLVQGDYERETVFDQDPVAAARRWVDEGATRLHVVDLDGAREGRAVNADAVERIVGLGLPVQVGGGIRDMATVERYRAAGVARIILGTAAISDPAFLATALSDGGADVVVSVDARGGEVAIEGWTETSGRDAVELARQLEQAGVGRLIYTDIASDGMLGGHDESALAANRFGGLDPRDRRRRHRKRRTDLRPARGRAAGVVLGRALYDGRLTLADAIAAAGAPTC